MIEVNLVPDVKQELIEAQRIRSMVIVGSVFVGLASVSVVALLLIYIFVVQSVRSNLADGAIKDGSQKLAKVADLSKSLTIQNQLTQISALNDKKEITSRIFDTLLKIIPPSPNDIQISILKIDTSTNLVTIDGQAPNSYAALEVFKKTIAGAMVNYSVLVGDDIEKQDPISLASSISTSNTSFGDDSTGNKVLRFTISFVCATELFASSSKDVSVSVKGEKNATDSYLGVPKIIFADKAKDITEGQ